MKAGNVNEIEYSPHLKIVPLVAVYVDDEMYVSQGEREKEKEKEREKEKDYVIFLLLL